MSILGFSRKEMDLRFIDTDRIKDLIPCAYPSLLDQYSKMIQQYDGCVDDIIKTWEPTNRFINEGILETSTVSDKIRVKILESTIKGYNVYTFLRGKAQIIIPAALVVDCDEIQCMVRRVYIMDKISGNNSNVCILYFPTEFRKKLPKSKKALKPHHINNGFTKPGEVIIIFRREDVLKVLLHELIHYFGMDRKYVQFNVRPSLYFMYHKAVNDLLIDEVITETMAFIWNIVIRAMELDVDHNSVYMAEMEHGIWQSARVLEYFGFRSIDEFDRGCCQGFPLEWNDKLPMVEVSTPAVVEYYIMRTALMFDLQRAHTAIVDASRTMEMLTLSFNDPNFRLAINNGLFFLNLM